MRLLIAVALFSTLLAGCGVSERFDSPENRINAAVPPDSGVQAVRQRLLAEIADQPEVQRALEPAWAARLRLRALSCSRDYTPTWRDSKADVHARLSNNGCFADTDRELQRWLGLQRLRLMLGQGPLRQVPQDLPQMISRPEPVSTLVVARDAPVALLRNSNGFEVIELGTGRSVFKEPASQGPYVTLDLSPNGRVFTMAMSGKVVIRASEGGETLVELQQTNGVIWLDSHVVAFRNGANSLRLLDLATGDDTAVPGAGSSYSNLAARAPGLPGRFDLFVHRGLDQIEVVNEAGRYEARLVAEKRTESGLGFASNTGGMSADGKVWMDAHQGLRIVNLNTLELEEVSFKPVGTQAAWPTPNPDEFVLAMHLPTGDGVTSRINYYVYNHRGGTLAQVTRDQGASTRYQYVPSMKRLALIDDKTIRFIEKLPTSEPQPTDKVLAAFIDEMNQRRLAAALADQAAPPGLGQSLPGGSTQGIGTTTPLQEQLRQAQVEGVGVYEGAGAKHGNGQARTPGVVEVRVRRSARPIALVLSSYEPVRWMIVSESGARLSAVLVGGYHDSTVTGAGAARVYQIGQNYAYGQQTSAYADLQRTVLRWTGKPMGVFQGRYSGASFSVGGGD